MIKFHPSLPAAIKHASFWVAASTGLGTLGTQLANDVHKSLCFILSFVCGVLGASVQSPGTSENKPENSNDSNPSNPQ